jgi:hypothetical protein
MFLPVEVSDAEQQQQEHLLYLLHFSHLYFINAYYGRHWKFTQESFIDGRDIPGGPSAFETTMFSIPIDMLGNVVMIMSTWFCDVINVSTTILHPLSQRL